MPGTHETRNLVFYWLCFLLYCFQKIATRRSLRLRPGSLSGSFTYCASCMFSRSVSNKSQQGGPYDQLRFLELSFIIVLCRLVSQPGSCFSFFVLILIFWPDVVQIWLWDAFQWLQNDQVYRIPTTFRPIWTIICKFRPIFDPQIEGFDLMIFTSMGLRVLTLTPLTLGWEPTVPNHEHRQR